jgi:hypothetical protein
MQLRTDLRAGTASPDTPTHLLRSAKIWETLEEIAQDPNPPQDILSVCKLVSECAEGMRRTRLGVAGALERLRQAADEDLGRIDRALADFCGLDPQNYYRACQLALWTEAERLQQTDRRIPTKIARKVAEAVEQNVPQGEHTYSSDDWEPFVLSRLPLAEGLRILEATSRSSRSSDKKIAVERLRSFHPEGDSDTFWGPSPDQDGARLAVRERNRESLREWVDSPSKSAETKELGLGVLVPALAEAERFDEALEYLEDILTPCVHDAAALNAIRACAASLNESDAQPFLARLGHGFEWVKGKVELMTSRLRFSGRTEAATTEMTAIEEEIAAALGNTRDAPEDNLPDSSLRGLSETIRKALAIGWIQIVYDWLENDDYLRAFGAAKRILCASLRSRGLEEVLAARLGRMSLEETLWLAEAVLHAAEEFDSFEHSKAVLNEVIIFLARSGNLTALQYALDLIEEKLAGAESLMREQKIQNTLRVFASSPPRELTWEETAVVANRILSATTRADCLYVLAIHALVEGEEEASKRLEHKAKQALQAANQASDSAADAPDSDFFPKWRELSEMMDWLRSRKSAETQQSDQSQWFSEALALAGYLRDFRADAFYAIARLLLESPPFPERGSLYRQAVEEIPDGSGFVTAAAYRNDLRRRVEESFSDPNDAGFLEPWASNGEAISKSRTAHSMDGVGLDPKLVRRKFSSTLRKIEEKPETAEWISKFIEAAAPKILNPIRKGVVEALFNAAEKLRPYPKTNFLATIHILSLEQRESEDARWMACVAHNFAKRAGLLPDFDAQVKRRLQPTPTNLKERVINLGLEDAFAEFEAEAETSQKVSHAHILFDKALASGDREAFFKAFNLAEDAFAVETSPGGSVVYFECAVEWLRHVGRLPSRSDRLHLLRRMWSWHDWLGLQSDVEFTESFVPVWAGQMAAADEVDLAEETVESLRNLDHRAHGYAEMVVGCGLTRGDARAEMFLGKFFKIAEEMVVQPESQFGLYYGLKQIAMACAEESDHQHLIQVVNLGRKLLLLNRGKNTYVTLLIFLFEALSAANRTDIWSEVLESWAQSKQLSSWDESTPGMVLNSIWENYRHSSEKFTLSKRLNFIDKICEIMGLVRPVKQWGCDEFRLLQICIVKPQKGDTPVILERFKALSSCSPDIVKGLLDDNPWSLRGAVSLPPPDEQMLCWISILCPYSEDAAIFFIAHVATRLLQAGDWGSLRILANDCSVLDLGWLADIAEAVLADK